MDEELLLVVFIGFFRVSAACTCTNSSRGTVCTSSAAGSDSDSYGVDCGGDWGVWKTFPDVFISTSMGIGSEFDSGMVASLTSRNPVAGNCLLSPTLKMYG
jgi:hypothetical protein